MLLLIDMTVLSKSELDVATGGLPAAVTCAGQTVASGLGGGSVTRLGFHLFKPRFAGAARLSVAAGMMTGAIVFGKSSSCPLEQSKQH